MSVTSSLGKAVITPKGAYNSATAYVVLDSVYSDGGSWLALKSVTGVTPVEGEYWTKLADRGPQGVSPSVTVTTTTTGHTLTITDADHPSGQTFDVLDGDGTSAASISYVSGSSYTEGTIGSALEALEDKATLASSAEINAIITGYTAPST